MGRKEDELAKLGMAESRSRRRNMGNILEEDDVPGAEGAPTETRMISVDLIDPSPFQPRKVFDQGSLEDLADNIDEIGTLLQPVMVRPVGDRYELIFGERRLRAFKLREYKDIPASIRHMDDYAAFRACATENLQRDQLPPFEVATMVKALRDNKVFKSVSQLTRLTGISNADYYRYINYFRFPGGVLSKLEQVPDAITPSYVDQFLKFVGSPDHEELLVLAVEKILDYGYTQAKAISWLDEQIKVRPGRAEKIDFKRHNGVKFASLSRSNKRIQITLTSEEDSLVLRERIQTLIEEYLTRETTD
jgi:ParB family chromosome partitioning protein